VDAIRLDRVTLARAKRIVLSEVSLAIHPGEFIGVFGPNGAGKTTLLQAILGLLRPVAGRLEVFGVAPMRGNRLAGYLPQHRASVAELCLRGWDFVASAIDGDRWGVPLCSRSWRPTALQRGRCANSPAAKCSDCFSRRRYSDSPSCFYSTNRS